MGPRPRGAQGAALYAQQWRGLWVKRALSARRDRLAVVTQLAVPVALVLLALWTRKASSAFPQEPALALSRCGTRFWPGPRALGRIVRGPAAPACARFGLLACGAWIELGRDPQQHAGVPAGPLCPLLTCATGCTAQCHWR